MLKSYEAIYDHGKLQWVSEEPPIQGQRRRIVVVMEVDQGPEQPRKETIRELLARTRGSLGGIMTVDEIDAEVRAMRDEWEREWDD